MTTVLNITRTDETVRVGPAAPHPARTAIVEARGALLWYDVLVPSVDTPPLPSAEIWDADLAGQWLWEIYGTEATAALLAGAGAITIAPGDSAPHAHALALTTWRSAWWPASHVAGVPALDPGLLAVERTLAIAELEHLLDDPDALHRAMVTLTELTTDAGLSPLTDRIQDRLSALAEDHGHVLDLRAAPLNRRDLALAAGAADHDGGHVEGSVLAQGTTPIDQARVAPGSVDFLGETQWRILRRDARTLLDVRVPRAPRSPRAPSDSRSLHGSVRPDDDLPLVVRFADLTLDLEADDRSFHAETEADPRLLLLPAEERAAHVHTPGLESMPSLPDADRGALVDWARGRLTALDASLAEADANPESGGTT